MPTVKLDINTGLEYSPTDGLDSLVKLHNFTVGTDGSIYKLPALKNLKNTWITKYPLKDSEKSLIEPAMILDFRKFKSVAISKLINEGITLENNINILRYEVFRRYYYLTSTSIGGLNIDYEKKVVTDDQINGHKLYKKYYNFESTYQPPPPQGVRLRDIFDYSPNIIINPVSDESEEEYPIAVFPVSFAAGGQHVNQNTGIINKNMISAPLNPNKDYISPSQFLHIKEKDSNNLWNKSDFARGPVIIGNRMIFYSTYANALLVSKPYEFNVLMPDSEDDSKPFKIETPEEVQGIAEFNGDLLLFTPTGIDRYVLDNSDEGKILIRDPTFKYHFRCRWSGSWVQANKDLYFFTDTFEVYVLRTNLSVETVFSGKLPSYAPISTFLDIENGMDSSFNMSHFKLLGYRFVSIGPWLYNMDTKTWSTYTYDGWQDPAVKDFNPEIDTYIWENDLSKRLIHDGFDDVICTYSTICTPLDYKEMDDLLDKSSENTLEEGKYQWGKVAMFTTRMYQQENTFSLDGILAYVRGGTLDRGDKLYLKILRGEDKGEIDEDDETTWGIPASYEPLRTGVLDSKETHHVGQFHWRTNVKCERFRVQIVTNSKKGLVVQSVLANLTMQGESLKQEQGQQQQ